MAIALGTGGQFLGKFPAERSRVAFLSGESGQFTIQETALRVCKARGVDLAAADVHWGFTLPQLARDEDVEALTEAVAAVTAKVVIIDPAYLCLLGGDTKGRNAGNLFDMGPLLMRLTQIGTDTDSTILLCHHFRKNGEQSRLEPPELEELSMAGFAEWPRQWLLIGRQEAYVPGSGVHKLLLNVGGSAGHSGHYGVVVNEGELQKDFSGRVWDVAVSGLVEAKREMARERETKKAKEQEQRELGYRDKLLQALRKSPDGETERELRKIAGLNQEAFSAAYRSLLAEGRIEQCRIKKANRSHDAYKWTGK